MERLESRWPSRVMTQRDRNSGSKAKNPCGFSGTPNMSPRSSLVKKMVPSRILIVFFIVVQLLGQGSASLPPYVPREDETLKDNSRAPKSHPIRGTFRPHR